MTRMTLDKRLTQALEDKGYKDVTVTVTASEGVGDTEDALAAKLIGKAKNGVTVEVDVAGYSSRKAALLALGRRVASRLRDQSIVKKMLA
jgi:hypothetical protein